MDFSASAVLQRIRNSLQNPANRLEGGFCMDNAQAVSEELARLDLMEVKPIPDRVLLDTAEGEYLDRKALDYNEIRNPAAAASGTLLFSGEPGTVIPQGTEALYGALIFETMTAGKISAGGICEVEAQCKSPGTAGNVLANMITMLRTAVDGINSVTNPLPFGGGAETESDDSFRERIFEKIRRPITSGNRNHYIYWAKQVSGVGGAKCLGAEVCGPGHVRVMILSDQFSLPDAVLMETVRNHIEKERPIGASVTVCAPTPVAVYVNIEVKLVAGYDLDNIRAGILEAIRGYVAEVNRTDFNTPPTRNDESRESTVSYYRVGDLIFGVDGVADITAYTLNGCLSSLVSGYEEFFVLSEVTVLGG